MDALLFPLLLALLAGFMFLSMRKQKKRMAEMQDMQNSVSTGARIQLTSGLYGTVIDATSSDFVDVEIATGMVTRWNRLAIMRVIPTDEAAATYAGHTAPEVEYDDYADHSDSVSLDKPSSDDARDTDK
ncbi:MULTISPECIES: preprotein translocase subunit YajC [Gordonia]|uniref:Preprotein translocase subunit YajC n=1 Tax=Gordonia amicalis TaxID=89053 RepID=A0ABU4D8L4_9ACTN|nr:MULTISPECIES: preprotein translocase subunit YajC [Gordonia]ATD70761.1 preprotein translocase subunit YajC [Gordonia sp. 1D]MBA5848477.1 preprotein translocase subunit YajC [Gordonia amicalis]MDV6306067.1 preprotein translocase subunit YajC [Gordonia amicalis]MDV7098662.1 preprotein translocase subunit YajC [Gordonia amicalis]MDV7172249.1 preprotein translocase subunit YajC [Gordonia amicalis]